MGGEIEAVRVTFDPRGSLAFTHESQGTDMGLLGGFLGWDTQDKRLVDSAKVIAAAGIRVQIDISDIGAAHPNTYKLTLENKTERHEMIAISTGGGMVEVIEIDGAPVSVAGDYFETLIFFEAGEEALIRYLEQHVSHDAILPCRGENTRFIQVKDRHFLSEPICSDLEQKAQILRIKKLSPVLPILSRKKTMVPFITC
jgi:L-serine dehydratase